MKVYTVTVEYNDAYKQRFGQATLPVWQDHLSYPPGTRREIWSVPGLGIHCEHGPAIRIVEPSGIAVLEDSYRNGRLTARVLRNEAGEITSEVHCGNRTPIDETNGASKGRGR